MVTEHSYKSGIEELKIAGSVVAYRVRCTCGSWTEDFASKVLAWDALVDHVTCPEVKTPPAGTVAAEMDRLKRPPRPRPSLGPLPTTTTWIVGSHLDCDWVVDGPYVSARHCQITHHADGRRTVADLGSTNGTFLRWKTSQGIVATRRVMETTRILDGEAVVIGRIELGDPPSEPINSYPSR